MKKILLLLVFLSSLFCFSCTVVKHCDLRFCQFTVKKIRDTKGDTIDTLWYTPSYTVHHPVGHVLPTNTLSWVRRNHPEKDVEFNIDGVEKWTSLPDSFYLIPQQILNEHPDKIPQLLSGDALWEDYKLTYDEFMSFTFDEHIEGTDPMETIYYCVFSAHKAQS